MFDNLFDVRIDQNTFLNWVLCMKDVFTHYAC